MINVMITSDIIGIIISFIILYGVRFEVRNQNEKTKYFALFIIINSIACMCEALSWIYDSQIEHLFLLKITTTVSYAIVYLEGYIYIKFAQYYISGKLKSIDEVPIKLHKFIPVYCIIMTIVVTALGLSGNLFSLSNATYSDTYYTEIYFMTTIVVFVYILVCILKYRSVLGVHDSIAMIAYIFIPLIVMGVNLIEPNLSLTYPSMTLTIVLLYVMLQYDNESNYIMRDQLLSYINRHDDLTGLPNRRAFMETHDALNVGESVGTVFFDINGLKYTNDNFGHLAGDKQILSFRDLLLCYFRKDEVYRISGDEFLVIMPGIKHDLFESRIATVDNRLNEHSFRIASMGASFGDASEIDTILKSAEDKMYQDKDEFYKNNPEFKRT